MQFLQNTRIRTRILAALVLPVFGLLIFAGMVLADKWRVQSEAEAVKEQAAFASDISLLVHELQKERGASALFLGSKGQQFGSELKAQREATNQVLARWKDAAGTIQADQPGLASAITAASKDLEAVQAIRAQVDSLGAEAPVVIGTYTKAIGLQLGMVEAMTSLSTDTRIAGLTSAYVNLMWAKERAGIERAVGSNGFAAKGFSPALFRRYIALGAEQETYFNVFRSFATPAQREALAAALKSPESAEVDRMRKIGQESAFTNDTGGILGPDWFAAATRRIDILKGVEDKVSADLMAAAGALTAKAGTQLTISLLAVLALLAVTVALVSAIVRGITGPLHGLAMVMDRLARGDTSVEVEGIDRGDEIGEMSRAVEVFKENRMEADRLAIAQAAEQEAKEKRRVHMEQLTRDFDAGVRAVLEGVASASTELQSTAESMSATAEQTSRQAGAAASAASEASTNVQTVAAAAEELSASISEISRQVAESATIARNAVAEADRTNGVVNGLSEAVQRIGAVVSLINDIASQTNLLALNATIEAARAGDAGKGFAVVAGEVKNLANQTARATEDIANQIREVQGGTTEAVEAIRTMASTVSHIDEISSAIAAAVEEQGAATQEIARNVQGAAEGTDQVTLNVAGVTEAAGSTGQAAHQVLEASNMLSRESEQLRARVEHFLADIKVA